jgi:hypothetical protein
MNEHLPIIKIELEGMRLSIARTYSDWMARGFSTERKWLPALSHMRALLNDTSPASSGDIRNGA